MVQISTSTEVNHLISKILYQKQNGLDKQNRYNFIQEILVALMKIDFHYGDDTSFIHMTLYQLLKRLKLYLFNVLKYNYKYLTKV